MNLDLINSKKDKNFYNLEEVLLQTNFDYTFEDYDNAVNPYSADYHKDESMAKVKIWRDAADNKRKSVKKILNNVGIDLEQYRSGRYFKIPFHLAELIYVLMIQDSSKGSLVSYLKLGKFDRISFEELSELLFLLSQELKKDFPNEFSSFGFDDFFEKSSTYSTTPFEWIGKFVEVGDNQLAHRFGG